MALTYQRTIRFADTDAAGVVYFANLLAIAHEAYEAVLLERGVDLRAFFRATTQATAQATIQTTTQATVTTAEPAEQLVVPIVHASIDFRQPLYCGDRLLVTPTPKALSPSEFEISYLFARDNQDSLDPQHPPQKPVAIALTRHVCITSTTRQRQALPSFLADWVGPIT